MPFQRHHRAAAVLAFLYLLLPQASHAQKPELVVQTEHTQSVLSVAFSPDGGTLASGSLDHTVKFWDAATGQLLRTLVGHTSTVLSVAFSPDGKTLATGSFDSTIKFWDAATGRNLGSLTALDQDDWAVVDPEGRFDASPGGMALMHYAVGLTPIALSQLKDRYYEPGLLAKLLGFNKEPLRDIKAFDHVDLFPDVKAPAGVPKSGNLTLSLANRGGGIGRVQVFVNGVELKADARGPGVSPDAKQATVTVDVSHAPSLVPGKPNTVEIVAWNKEGYLSSPRAGFAYVPDEGATKPLMAPPDLYAIVCGIDAYASPDLHLTYPDKDAAGFARALEVGAKGLLGPGGGAVHLTRLGTSGRREFCPRRKRTSPRPLPRQNGPGPETSSWCTWRGMASPFRAAE